MNVNDLTEREIEIFRLGMKAGVWLYAHYKGGVQYVGTCGTTYAEAISNLDRPITDTGPSAHLGIGIAIADGDNLPNR